MSVSKHTVALNELRRKIWDTVVAWDDSDGLCEGGRNEFLVALGLPRMADSSSKEFIVRLRISNDSYDASDISRYLSGGYSLSSVSGSVVEVKDTERGADAHPVTDIAGGKRGYDAFIKTLHAAVATHRSNIESDEVDRIVNDFYGVIGIEKPKPRTVTITFDISNPTLERYQQNVLDDLTEYLYESEIWLDGKAKVEIS